MHNIAGNDHIPAGIHIDGLAINRTTTLDRNAPLFVGNPHGALNIADISDDFNIRCRGSVIGV